MLNTVANELQMVKFRQYWRGLVFLNLIWQQIFGIRNALAETSIKFNIAKA
jgi:hypothetical protein